mmetsp:Transcript_56924/g.157550  ORF Transcript_56924/g.157550 Transcript_56924/m.157550 type:complete len:225 (+) Transcript_56924:984-1658(+)
MWITWCWPVCELLAESPPRKKDVPRTRRRFERMEPSNVHFTTSSLEVRSVCTVSIISTAFPSVAFRRPLSVSLRIAAANSSVASPRNLASGTMPAMFSQKVQAGPQPQWPEATPNGRNTKSTEKGCRKIDFNPSQLFGPSNVETSGLSSPGPSPGTTLCNGWYMPLSCTSKPCTRWRSFMAMAFSRNGLIWPACACALPSSLMGCDRRGAISEGVRECAQQRAS